MTEINKVSGTTSNQQVQTPQIQNQVSSHQIGNQQVSNTPNDTVIVNNVDNSKLIPPIGNENPFVQNPFYQAQQANMFPNNQPFMNQFNQTNYVPMNQPFINQANYSENTGNNLWKYLLAGGLGLFTGLALGSMMPYSYYCYYPMYYSYFYSPCWYNFGWNYWWW
ncbi:MAG: hypothetical protein NZM44_01475 [Candidatus Calescibacterium sp.]|nr:hypothetical protein [Candidatus Calescibacterium sp.]MCX7757995.1 hypothetical protein [bacterium]